MSARQETLKGTLSRIRFESDDGEFAVCELDARGHQQPVTIVGNILSTKPGEAVEVTGSWTVDPQYGRQFSIEQIRAVPPTSREGIEKYLASDLVEGIGEVLAERIVDHFGTDTLDILDEDPERIKEVDGIGAVRGDRISDAWKEQRAIRSVMVFLQSHGISQGRASKIWQEYGPEATRIVQENPYRLADDVRGIGFKTADRIAGELGIEPEADERLRAGLLYELSQASSEGHMYLPVPQLEEQAAERLDVPRGMLDGPLESLRAGDDLVVEPGLADEPPAAYRAESHGTEVGAARQTRALLSTSSWIGDGGLGLELDDRVASVESSIGFELADAQREAVGAAWKTPVVVITGGPGTGKTTIVEAVCMLGDDLGRKIELAAPTGRAAKRLSEATGRQAQTIHRLLEYSFEEGGFQYDEDRPLDVDMLIVDEASMLDTYLFHSVVRALPPEASLLLVGDVDQLPSVGPGDVLADLIRSGEVEVVELTEIFRQAERSTIVVNAHRINNGQMPVTPRRDDGELVDFYTISADSPEAARERIVRAVSDRIPEAFDYDPLEDIQILSPMHRGEVGCSRLNQNLQRVLNPSAETFQHYSTEWKIGDRVMQTRNNYDLEVFNGDIGCIRAVDEGREVVQIEFEGRYVAYPFESLDELELAYAITIHKSQGSEYPAVVIPVMTQHYIMLQRNLLYTAVTRARELVVLVGSRRAVEIAVDNDDADSRYTRLDRRIHGDI